MAENPTIVSIDNLSKRFIMHKDKSLKERLVNFGRARQHRDDFWALRNVSLDIPTGETLGLVGHNGSGKSTLLKTIGGIIQPTSGSVQRRGRLAALLELGAGFHPDLTGRDNVYLNAAILGLTRKETDRYFDAIVDFSGIESFIDTQVKFYSSGMYVRLAFAVAVHVDPDLLLVDEVLAVGDEPFQRKCMAKIAEFQSEGRTIVLVSHSADQVGSLCDRVVVLHQGEITHDGDPAEGIRILREGYEADRKLSDKVAEGADARRPAYSITSVDATTREDAESISIILDYLIEIFEPQDEWGIGLSIENSLGLHIYSMTSFGLNATLPNTVGSHRVRITLPDVRLGAGSYVVNTGLGNQSGLNFDERPRAASFDVTGAGFGYGLIRISPDIAS
ncbi:ABC transporter ATP-binding protein [Glaciibacter superstes]|uniref:ABC transporter ATP-binding protein n=1 Tax=Glaciibacter superstes TaxID=501023 RepID=UPI0003B62402|nr:ABC transporter ATP-binding protein [Glaciibacter superstes]